MTRSSNKKKQPPLQGEGKRRPLLIDKYKKEVIDAVKSHRVVIIVGQTGCGKSTQVPQYLHYNRDVIGLSNTDKIACLHPRSVAASSLAERVSEETKTKVGDLVGYKIRFYTLCNPGAKIEYMTAGFMSRLLGQPDEINKYGIVIIDEAHQRSVDNDVVMGQMKKIMVKDKRVRLVIMSATLNVSEMTQYYPEAFIIDIPSSGNNVDVIYKTVPGNDYVQMVGTIVIEIVKSESQGHILVFLPSEEKVWKCRNMLKKFKLNKIIPYSFKILPFYGAMDHSDKVSVFQEYKGFRKIIVATNIAETSLTIEGVQFVIDTGFVKRVRYDHERRIDHWVTDRVSGAESDQRKGRAGRTGTNRGTCYRLYDRFQYDSDLEATLGPFLNELNKTYSLAQLRVVAENVSSLSNKSSWTSIQECIKKILDMNPIQSGWVSERYPVPEISIANLDSTVLIMISRKVDIITFPFIVPPDPSSVRSSIAHLKDLSLLEDNGVLTPLGTQVSRLPLTPEFGKVACLASKLTCREDVFIIISMLSRPILDKSSKKTVHKDYNYPSGDLVKLFSVFEEAEQNHFKKNWCKENGVIFSNLKYCRLVYAQLCSLLQSPFPNSSRCYHPVTRLIETKMVFLSGFFQKLFRKTDDGYQMWDGKAGKIHTYSCVDNEANYVLPIFVQAPLSSNVVTMKECMSYDMDLLMTMNPRQWRIRTNLWKDVLAGLKIHPSLNGR